MPAEPPPAPKTIEELFVAYDNRLYAERRRFVLFAVAGLVVLALAVYGLVVLTGRREQRKHVEAARVVLRSPLSADYERDAAIRRIDESGSAARDALPELLALLAADRNDYAVIKILTRLGSDAAEAVPLLMLRFGKHDVQQTTAALDAIDPGWRDRPAASAVAAEFLARATDPDPNGPSTEASERRMRAAAAVRWLSGDDPDRAHKHLSAWLRPSAERVNRLAETLVENLEDSPDAAFLLAALGPDWERWPAVRKAHPALVARVLARHNYDDGRDPTLDAVCARIVARVPADAAVPVCRVWDFDTHFGGNGMRVRLLGHYGPDARARAVESILASDRWPRQDRPSSRVREVYARVRELDQLDPNWVRHPRAATVISELIALAASYYATERELARQTLDRIDPNWARHPNARLAAPLLAARVDPEHLRTIRFHPEGTEAAVSAIDLLAALGPLARDVLPRLILARAAGLPPENQGGPDLPEKVREVLTAALARLPDAVDPNWELAPQALAAIPDLIALLDQRPAAAAEMLGRFGPSARCALPALRGAAQKATRPADRDAIEAAIRRIDGPGALTARPSAPTS